MAGGWLGPSIASSNDTGYDGMSFSDLLRKIFLSDPGTPAATGDTPQSLANNPLLAYLQPQPQPTVASPWNSAQPMQGPAYNQSPQNVADWRGLGQAAPAAMIAPPPPAAGSAAAPLPAPIDVASLPVPAEPPAAPPPLPPKAQFVQQQGGVPAAPPADSGFGINIPGVGNSLAAGFQSWANTAPGNPIAGLANLLGGMSTGQRVDPQGIALQNMQNMYVALRQRGFPHADALAGASNPEMLKTMLTPVKVAPGEQLVNPNLPGAAGGGASGSNNAGVVFANNSGILGKDVLTGMADQYLAGDQTVFQNLGRGSTAPINIANLRQRVLERMNELGVTPAQQASKMAEMKGYEAAQKTLGARSANIEMAVTEANQLAPQVLQTSAAVNRTNYPALNKVILAAKEGTGDPGVVKFSAALNSFINVYSRAVNPFGSTTVNDKEHARELLSTYWANGQINAGVQQLQKEMELARTSPDMVRDAIRRSFTDGSKGASPISVGSGTVANGDLSAPTATGPNGQRVILKNGQWVPLKQ